MISTRLFKVNGILPPKIDFLGYNDFLLDDKDHKHHPQIQILPFYSTVFDSEVLKVVDLDLRRLLESYFDQYPSIIRDIMEVFNIQDISN